MRYVFWSNYNDVRTKIVPTMAKRLFVEITSTIADLVSNRLDPHHTGVMMENTVDSLAILNCLQNSAYTACFMATLANPITYTILW